MKRKFLLALASIFACVLSADMSGYRNWQDWKPSPAPTSTLGRYATSARDWAIGGAILPGGVYLGLGYKLGKQLDESAEKAEEAGSTAAKYGYQALSHAVLLASLAGAGVSTYLASPMLAVTGGALGLGVEAYKDIAHLLSEIQTKVDNNQLSPQEAIKLAEQLEEETKELQEHIPSAQERRANA